MTLDQIARVCHAANSAYCEAVGDPVLPHWDNLEESYRQSTRAGVSGVITGNGPRQSHEGWITERTAQGWVHGPVLDREKKIHPCLVPYDELPEAQRVKDHLFGAIVRTLSPDLVTAQR